MTEVTMPKLSMNMSRGTVTEWFVEDGDAVEEGQHLLEVESEKATSVVEAPAAGTVDRSVEAGDDVAVGAVLATITESDDVSTLDGESVGRKATTPAEPGSAASDDGEDAGPADRIRATPSARRAARERGVALEAVAESRESRTVTRDDVEAYASIDEPSGSTPSVSRIAASPAARQAARTHEVDLAAVDGSGPEGAVVRQDVEAAATSAPGASTDRAAPVRDRRELSSVRRTIADRLGQSWRTAPHVTVDREIEVGPLLDLREQLNAGRDLPIAFEDLFLLATAEALDRHPDFNATLEGDEHVRYDRADIALAVDTDRGLLSPVLRDVGGKRLAALAAERAELVERTREGDVDPHQLAGGTFTLTNLGPFDVDAFTPIINPPQVAILGLGAVRRAPREATDGTVDFRDVLTASLSFDHRAVDGADAARFLDTFAELLGRPAVLLVD